MKKKNMRSLTAITWLLALAMLVAWGTGMYCLTAVTAEYAASRYLADYYDYASTITKGNLEYDLSKEYDLKFENFSANRMWKAADYGGHARSFHSLTPSIYGNVDFMARPNHDLAYSATAIFNSAGELLACSWKDYFYFEYLTEKQWQSREERSGNNARAFFDRENLTDAGRELVNNGTLTVDAAAMRFTGVFDGVDFTPQSVAYIDSAALEAVLHSKRISRYTVSGVVEEYDLPWLSLYENPNVDLHSGEPVTFYSDWFDVCYRQPSPAFVYKGKDYDSVGSLAAELGPELVAGRIDMTSHDGLDFVIPSVNYCFSIYEATYYTPDYYGKAAYAEETSPIHFYTVSVVYCSPWRTAFGELSVVYIITLLLAAVLVFAVRSVIKRHLILPVQAVGKIMEKEEDTAVFYPETSKVWHEARILQDGFIKYGDKLRMQKNEVARLNAALEYAKTAEQNRRQLTSHIAHELKTPLAIIHSYAEGLKEYIAEDKRDQYIDVILSETERTDSMVLEMFDLSRLEAGKVKLSRDDFSLISLTQAVFEKLDMAAQAKQLQIDTSFPDDFLVTADEGRMAQVIENFVTNAIKYSPVGGRIAVSIQRKPAGTTFTIENESEPLSDQALRKVWDTFYRADEARGTDGSGLGLAIAKNIVQLHGGTCAVCNTAGGVKFRFTVP